MVSINLLLSLLIKVSLVALIVVVIVIGIRLIYIMDKVDKILDDVLIKLNKIDGIFDSLGKIDSKFSMIKNTFISFFTNIIFRRKRRNEK